MYRLFALIIALVLSYSNLRAQQSDNENGTFTNPILWADFPDNDFIRVGDTYYMVSTTMFVFPGVPILKSKDLINWEYASNAVERMDAHPFYNMEGGTRYAHGQWATSLRYHNGTYYALFVTLDEGGFVCTTKDPEGTWKVNKLPKAYYDPGLFFDEDGKAYVAHGYSKLSVTEVNPENIHPISKDSLTYEGSIRPGLEGWHVYKINGYYYFLCTYGGGDGFQACLRSKNIYGPYEEKVILNDDMNLTGKGVHQAGIVETQTGEYWSIIFQDADGVGRYPTIQPVEWNDGWPMIGKNGKAVVTSRKPNVGANHTVKVLPTSDEFNSTKMGPQWAWNHNPNNEKWSLTERKGYLRLKTAKVVKGIRDARNTLTQRIIGPYSTATMELEVKGMKDGDVTGLCLFQDPHAFIALKVKDGKKMLIMVNNGQSIDSVANIKNDKVYLRAHVVTITDKASFYYSFDNKSFTKLGNDLDMKFSTSIFTGNKFFVFNYATKELGGVVDINWFRVDTPKGPRNLYHANSMIEGERYDEIHLADTEVCKDIPNLKDQNITNIIEGSWLKFDQIDFGTGVTNFYARVATINGGGNIELRLDNLNGPIIGTCKVGKTGGWQVYQTVSCPVTNVTGKHTLFLKFVDGVGKMMNLNWFSFNENPQTFKIPMK